MIPGSDLAGRNYVVAGGAGGAGSCTVIALLRRGADVAVPSRSKERIDRLRSLADELAGEAAGARLHTQVCDISAPSGPVAVRAFVTGQFSHLDGVVAALGTYWREEPLSELPPGLWASLLHDNLTVHFLAAQTLLPLLAASGGGVYATLSGIAASEPMKKGGPLSVSGAGQRMLLRVFAEEMASTPVRFHEVAILTPLINHWTGYPVQPGWVTEEELDHYLSNVMSPDFPDRDVMLLSIPEPGSPRVWWRHDV